MKANKLLAEIIETAFDFSEDLLKILLRFSTLLSRVKYEDFSSDLDSFFRKYESIHTKFSGRKIVIPSLEPIDVSIFSSVEKLAQNRIIVSEGYTEFMKMMFPHGIFLTEFPTDQTTINIYNTTGCFKEYVVGNEIGGSENCVLNLSQVIYLMKNFNTFDSENRNDVFKKYTCSIFFMKNQRGEIISFAVEPRSNNWRWRTQLFGSCPGWMGGQLLYSRV
jgi:hypothetical protein